VDLVDVRACGATQTHGQTRGQCLFIFLKNKENKLKGT
jgi:hypothetical protein